VSPAVATLPRKPAHGLFPGQPLGLTVVVLTGMWEVFALSGMRTVLVFYLVQDLHFSDAAAIRLYSLSTAAAFAMTLVGAIIADTLLGVRRAVILGALLMAGGHLLLVAPAALFPALTLVVLGSGLFKPSLVSQIGHLYAPDDPRRDRAFVLYKAGCNAGAIISPIACGLVGEAFGWPAALALCGVVMCLAAAIFLAGLRTLPTSSAPPAVSDAPSSPSVMGGGRAFLLPLALVMLSAALFWSAHGQQGGTIALWADRDVDRAIHFGRSAFVIPATWFQSVNPIVIVLLTPVLTWFWSRRGEGSNGPGELRKMAIGAGLLTTCFIAVAGAAQAAHGHPVSPLWLTAALVLLATGELYFDAIGQAFLVRLAPRRAIATVISLWFLVQAFGFVAAGWLGQAWAQSTPAAYFAGIAGLAAAAGGLACAAAAARRKAA